MSYKCIVDVYAYIYIHTYTSDMNFTGAFTLELPYGVSSENDWPLPFLGNGKIAMYPSWDVSEGINNSAKCVLASEVMSWGDDRHAKSSQRHDLQVPLLVDVFRTGIFRIARLDAGQSLYESDHAELDLFEGVFRRRFVVLDKLTGRNAATISSETYVPRQYPCCTMQTLDLTVHPAQVRQAYTEGLRLYHGARPPDHIEPLTCRYKYSAYSTGSGEHPTPLYVFSGCGRSSIDGSYVSFASAYFWEGDPSQFQFVSEGDSASGATKWCEMRLKYPGRGALPRPEHELINARLHVLTGHSQSLCASHRIDAD